MSPALSCRLLVAAVAMSLVATTADADTVSWTRDRPTVLTTAAAARVAIRASPERGLYRNGALPQVTIEAAIAPGMRLAWSVRDGFGRTLRNGAADADEAPAAIPVTLPPGHGYYEIVTTLTRGEKTIGEARRSLGALAPPPATTGDEPFGLWIQGSPLYPDLGVRWTREGIYWKSYANRGADYLRDRIALFEQRYHAHGIRVIAYPKHPHPHQVSREVIEDTPRAWHDLEAWWTEMVRTLAGHVDAWAVVNEPTGRSWQGDNRLILRYWALMRKIVDRYDPGTPLLGPSLNSGDRAQMAQYQDLLDAGFGRYIDVVEMHTYTNAPERDWPGETRRVREMTARATGRELPVWSTEHGYTATYGEELRQARLLVRSGLVARRLGYPVLIWHMFGNPEGRDRREVQFAIFRSAVGHDTAPQPRPAGLAFGEMTRQLAGMRFAGTVDGLGAGVEAYEFVRDGAPMVALWRLDKTAATVSLPVDPGMQPTITDMFGRVRPGTVRDDRLVVTVDRNPVYVTGVAPTVTPPAGTN